MEVSSSVCPEGQSHSRRVRPAPFPGARVALCGPAHPAGGAPPRLQTTNSAERLGIVFLPFATLIYALLYTPGIGLTGWEWFWVVVAGLFDIVHWAASASQRSQLPGRRSTV
jgi:hypothetical protein